MIKVTVKLTILSIINLRMEIWQLRDSTFNGSNVVLFIFSFLDHYDRISHATFVPSVQDILFIRKPTLGVQEHLFVVDSMNYR